MHIEWTAPTVPAEQDYLDVVVTAKPDDDSTSSPGTDPIPGIPGPPALPGDREDDHAPKTGVRLTIRVIKNCPTTADLTGDPCIVDDFTPFWEAGLKTGGHSSYQTVVSGGTPPDPPNNWNGLFIKEFMELHPTDPGSATADDFDYGYAPADFCEATVQGFVVGQGSADYWGCEHPEANDKFWDLHGVEEARPLLKDGLGDKTVKCKQWYKCGTTQLTNTFKITDTFHNDTYDPDGGGPAAAYRVVEVSLLKAKE